MRGKAVEVVLSAEERAFPEAHVRKHKAPRGCGTGRSRSGPARTGTRSAGGAGGSPGSASRASRTSAGPDVPAP